MTDPSAATGWTGDATQIINQTVPTSLKLLVIEITRNGHSTYGNNCLRQ